MSTAITTKHTRTQILNIIFIVSFALIIAAMAMMSTDDLKKTVTQETQSVQTMLGDRDWRFIKSRVDFRFQKAVFDSGFFDVLKEIILPEVNSDDPIENAINNDFLYRWVNNIQIILYQAVFRITMLEHWALTLLPLTIAIIGTGFNRWRIKRYYMGGTHANLVRLYLKASWFLVLSLITYVVFPNILSIHNPYIPPVILVLIAFIASRIIANYQKM